MFLCAIIPIFACLLFISVSVMLHPILPELGLPESEPLIPFVSEGGANPVADGTVHPHAQSANHPHVENATKEAEEERVTRYAFLVNWDEEAFSALKRHARDLDVVVPLWLHLHGTQPEIESDNPGKQQLISGWLKQNAPSLAIIPAINNFDETESRWRGEDLALLLASPEGRLRLVSRLSSLPELESFEGLLVDFEDIPSEQQSNFVTMVGLLSTSLHAKGKKLLVLVPGGDDAYDVARLSLVADSIVVATYDEHVGVPGPLAAQSWFEEQLGWVLKIADPKKIIVGIGSYSHDWSEGRLGKQASVADAWDLLEQSRASLAFDPNSLNPTFSYKDIGSDKIHRVWFLDGATAFNQTATALRARPAGLALWRLGTEDESIWNFFARGHAPDEGVLPALARLDPTSSVSFRGAGEIMKMTGKNERVGIRRLEYDRHSSLIRAETITALPKRLTLSRYGLPREKVIALTFDDGPSADYTPAILNILKNENVRATFFVTGLMAILHPDVLRRAYAEGHDIGNHTFTHPELSALSKWQLSLELTATQRAIESELGVRTSLFREPYGSDEETIAASEVGSIKNASELGYATVGMRINPKDWLRPGVKSIVDRIVAQAENGNGNVVLLHDAGGDRSETVLALPQIIAELRARGFRFVTIHELLGLPRSAVMPDVPSEFRMAAAVEWMGFSLIRIFRETLVALVVIVIGIAAIRLFFIAIAATLQARRAREREGNKWCPRSFAVIIPAYNESKVIVKSVTALLGSPLTNFKIFVVDDGSSDDTVDRLRTAFTGNDRVRVLQKTNGGKSAALNHGLRRTRAEVIVTLDADTVVDIEALPWLVRHFSDPRIGAVAGAALVGNAVNSITRFQSLEYVTSQNLDRRALELANGIQVVPGAIGAWRHSALQEVGCFTSDTLAEDADATVRLERAEWRVLYEPRAMAYTEAPETIRTFMQQRFRWMFGTLQTAFKHRSAYLQSGSPGVKFCTIPNIFIFQFLFALISPVMDLLLLFGVASWFLFFQMHPGIGVPQDLWLFVGYWGGFQMLELCAAALAFKLDARDNWWRLLPLVIVQRFCYRQLLYWVAIRSSAAAIKGRFVGWGKLQRTGKVTRGQVRRPGVEQTKRDTGHSGRYLKIGPLFSGAELQAPIACRPPIHSVRANALGD
jgi:peptidoglycan-N-acetylglucosamine deacetylase